MKIQLDTLPSGYLIQGYAQGEIRVRAPAAAETEVVVHRRSLILVPDRCVEWEPQTFDDLSGSHFEAIAELGPEVILIGSGARLRLPSGPLMGVLASLGIGFEVMDTGAACRTYNVLLAAGRVVAAALIV